MLNVNLEAGKISAPQLQRWWKRGLDEFNHFQVNRDQVVDQDPNNLLDLFMISSSQKLNMSNVRTETKGDFLKQVSKKLEPLLSSENNLLWQTIFRTEKELISVMLAYVTWSTSGDRCTFH